MRKTLGIAASVGGIGLFLLAHAVQISNYLGVLQLPSDVKDALMVLASIPTAIAWGVLILGLFSAGYLVYDSGHHRLALAAVRSRGVHVEASSLIIGGLVIVVIGAAIAGVGLWLQSRLPAPTATSNISIGSPAIAIVPAPPPVPITSPAAQSDSVTAAELARAKGELEKAKQEAETAEDARKSALLSVKSDNERMDAALYEMFDAITKEAIPAFTEAGYLVQNWHMKLATADGRRDFIVEIDKIRSAYVKFILHLNRIYFKDYNYYIKELRDDVLGSGGVPDLHGELDKLKILVQALPETSTLDTVRLIAPQLEQFGKTVQSYAGWINKTRNSIRQKRDELAKARQ